MLPSLVGMFQVPTAVELTSPRAIGGQRCLKHTVLFSRDRWPPWAAAALYLQIEAVVSRSCFSSSHHAVIQSARLLHPVQYRHPYSWVAQASPSRLCKRYITATYRDFPACRLGRLAHARRCGSKSYLKIEFNKTAPPKVLFRL